MEDDFFQTRKSDFFQSDFLPGRDIPHPANLDPYFGFSKPDDRATQQFAYDERNTSDWITVVYHSVYFATRASQNLRALGLKAYYPKTRIVLTNYIKDEVRERMTAAYGRYLFIQLPECPLTLHNLPIDEALISGPLNQNGVANIITIGGQRSITRHSEIEFNRKFIEDENKRADPKSALRFHAGQVVLVTQGSLEGYYVYCLEDIKMSYKLKSKVEIQVSRTGARHYIKVGALQHVDY